MSDLRNVLANQMTVSQELILGFSDGIDERSARARLPGQGESLNWVLGHVAVNEDWFLQLLTGSSLGLPPGWRDTYQPDASPPIAEDQAAPLSELTAAFRATRARALAAVAAEDPSSFAAPAPAGLPRVFVTRGDVWGLVATHPYWHVGHLATIRPMLALPTFSLS